MTHALDPSAPELPALARVLCQALVDPGFEQALLADPLQALQRHPELRAALTDAELQLLIQPGCRSLRELAARIEWQRPGLARSVNRR